MMLASLLACSFATAPSEDTWRLDTGSSDTDPLLDAEPAGEVVLNEVLADNREGATDEEGEHEDWLELYNADSEAIDLTGWSLYDDDEEPWIIAGPLSLEPGQFVLIWCDDEDEHDEDDEGTDTDEGDDDSDDEHDSDDDADEHDSDDDADEHDSDDDDHKDGEDDTPAGVLHAAFKLSRNGERITLLDADGARADSVRYPELSVDQAWGRSPDGTGSWGYREEPTPGANNR
jgi:hypothetical protein